MAEIALVLGSSGHFGRHAALALEQAGWTVRRFDRKQDDMTQAAKGAAIIVNGMNPPGYRNWDTEVPRITAQAIAAANASGATLIVPGNVYVYGRQTSPWSAATPQIAASRKGVIRVAMESSYRQAAREGVQVIILRAGDFIDDHGEGLWFDFALTKSLARGRMVYPGRTDIAHAWTWLPDMGRAVAILAARRAQLPAFSDLAMPGINVTGQQMLAAMARVTGKTLRMAGFSWTMIRLIAPFWVTGREVLEMRYLWNTPHELDGSDFLRLVPDFVVTPLDTVLAASLKGKIDPDQPVA